MSQRKFDLVTISSGGWDNVTFVTTTGRDERAHVERRLQPRPSGMGSNGLAGTRCLNRRVALATVVGADIAGRNYCRAIAGLGIGTEFIFSIDGATTNQRFVYQAKASRYIVKDDGATFRDLPLDRLERLLALASQTTVLVVGNIPMSLTIELADRCKQANTAFCLAPGAYQLSQLSELSPQLLVLNEAEGREATGTSCNNECSDVFQRLIETSPASMIVQTGGGANDAFLFMRSSGQQWRVAPGAVAQIEPNATELDACGTGDVAAIATMLGILAGMPLVSAYSNWGRTLATAYLLGRRFDRFRHFQTWRRTHAHSFTDAEEIGESKLVA